MRSDGRISIAVALVLSISGSTGFAIAYSVEASTQLLGVSLAVALFGLGTALIGWGKTLLPHEQVEEPAQPSGSSEARDSVHDEVARGGAQIARRPFLLAGLLSAVGALGAAVVFPVRSIGMRAGRWLYVTPWRAGARVVDERGQLVRADDMGVGNVLTVFPEHAVGDHDAQAMLVRVPPNALRLEPSRLAGAPDGLVCYSKICTHAGCPVALYRSETHELWCPCHQSAFNVLEGARPVFGPAARPLPQLPIRVDDEGYLRALGDFTDPVGPGFWTQRG